MLDSGEVDEAISRVAEVMSEILDGTCPAAPDWLDPRNKAGVELLVRMTYSAVVDADRLDTAAHFKPGTRPRPDMSMAELWDLRTKRRPPTAGDPQPVRHRRSIPPLRQRSGRPRRSRQTALLLPAPLPPPSRTLLHRPQRSHRRSHRSTTREAGLPGSRPQNADAMTRVWKQALMAQSCVRSRFGQSPVSETRHMLNSCAKEMLVNDAGLLGPHDNTSCQRRRPYDHVLVSC